MKNKQIEPYSLTDKRPGTIAMIIGLVSLLIAIFVEGAPLTMLFGYIAFVGIVTGLIRHLVREAVLKNERDNKNS